jgi:uncharacterized protein YlxW (UPF0749 family)
MHRLRSQLAVTAVAMILGLLVVAQLRAGQVAPGLSAMSAQDLTQLVASLNAGNEQLRREVANLGAQLADLNESRGRGEDSLGDIQDDLDRVRSWAGLGRVSGPGVVVTISGRIEGAGVEDLINELRNAGAEAIAVGEVRLVPGSVVAGPAGGLSIENTTLGDPLEIRVIGSPETLTGSMTRVGGPIAQLAATYPLATVTVTPIERIELPATERTLIPDHGQAVIP